MIQPKGNALNDEERRHAEANHSDLEVKTAIGSFRARGYDAMMILIALLAARCPLWRLLPHKRAYRTGARAYVATDSARARAAHDALCSRIAGRGAVGADHAAR